ncbi:hypothetical protein GJ496_001910 [Pomphorhynchus laevis]|nr:hypothetical protein GJ496_001910 [Pomphorhynchus laevis]
MDTSSMTTITRFQYWCFVLSMIVLPCLLLYGSVARFSISSLIYLIALLIYPSICPLTLKLASKDALRFGKFLCVISVYSGICSLAQLSIQLFAYLEKTTYNDLFRNCSPSYIHLKEIGFQRLDLFYRDAKIRLASLDLFVFIGFTSFAICWLTFKPWKRTEQYSSSNIFKHLYISSATFELVTCLLLGLSSPSLLNLPLVCIPILYFYLYSLVRCRFRYRLFLIVYISSSIFINYLYQLQTVYEKFKPDLFWVRLLGLWQIVKSDCYTNGRITMASSHLPTNLILLNPLLLFLHIVLSLSKRISKRIRNRRLAPDITPQEEVVYSPHSSFLPAKMSTFLALVAEVFVALFRQIVLSLEYRSYLFSLICLILWSVVFYSWASYILLIWSCILWTLPNSRLLLTWSSPFYAGYCILLLMIQYFFSFRLTNSEFPTTILKHNVSIEEILCQKLCVDVYDPVDVLFNCQSFRSLLLQVFMLFVFMLTIKQRYRQRTSEISYVSKLYSLELFDEIKNIAIRIGRYLNSMFIKYWILVCHLFLLIFCTVKPILLYKIVYLVIFFISSYNFIVSYQYWKLITPLICRVVVAYSMILINCIYICQFNIIYSAFRSMHIDKVLEVIGLIKYETHSQMISALLLPLLFVASFVVHLHFIHSSWLVILEDPIDSSLMISATSDLNRSSNNIAGLKDRDTQEDIQKGQVLIVQVVQIFRNLSLYLWRLLEIHERKLFALTLVTCSICPVSLMNFVFFCLMIVVFNMKSLHYEGIYSFALMWSCFCIMCQFIFQLQIIPDNSFKHTCVYYTDKGIAVQESTNSDVWIGLSKSDSLFKFVIPYVIIIGVIFVLTAAKYKQINRRAWITSNTGVIVVQPPFSETLFPCDATINISTSSDGERHLKVVYNVIGIKNIDDGIMSLVKYLVNFGFYRFGLELCFAMIAMIAMIRLDVFSFLYIIVLLPILLSTRSMIRNFLWPLYVAFVTCSNILQYLNILGLPPRSCFAYPWSFIDRNGVISRVCEWMFLPDYKFPPDARKLIVDYFLLLFIYQQSKVFINEMSAEYVDVAGSNEELDYSQNIRSSNPTLDFTTLYKSKLDVLKNLVFQHGFTAVTGILYATATTRVSIFCLIYLILSFVFFWNGTDLLLRPISTLIRIWNIPVYFCYTVLILKTLFQLISCLGTDWIECWFAQLLSLACLKPGLFNYNVFGDANCFRVDIVSNFMDGFCFFFLLIQKRIFRSYYFQHVVIELKTASRLASHGAIILNRLLEEEVQISVDLENAEIAKLRDNIERIQCQQAKLSHSYREANEHFEAIRSADYYMFEDLEDVRVISMTPSSAPKNMAAHSSGVVSEQPEDVPDNLFSRDISNIVGEDKIDLPPYDRLTNTPSFPNESIRTLSLLQRGIGFLYRQASILKEWILPVFNSAVLISIDWLDSRSSYLSQIDKELKQERKLIKNRLIVSNTEWRNGIGEFLDEVDVGEMIDDTLNYMDDSDHFDDSNDSDVNSSKTTALLRSVYFYIVANSDVVCYFFMIINHLLSASVLSIMLPLSVFLWAMLCVPRPPRLYWILVITYTEAIIVFKYMYQFRLNLLFNNEIIEESSIFYPFRVLGVESIAGSTFDVSDLFLLLALFFHKSMQKRMGLWKSSTDVFSLDVVDGPSIHRLSRLQRLRLNLRNRFNTWTMKHSLMAGFRSETIMPVRDVYAIMVSCDLISLLVLMCSYSSFGGASEGSDVVQSLKEDKVPVAFFTLLFIQFIFLVVDRSLYLRKNVVGKTIFQIVQVIAVHIWLFFVLPLLTKRRFVHNTPAQLWYLLKCLYFGYSAIQIKCRYPTQILGSVFTKSYDYFHLFCFKLMLLIPFVYEIRTIMDWVFTDTCLSLMSWLQAEDIFASVYQLKCWRVAEKNSPTPRGVARDTIWKYCSGGIFVLLIFFIIWFPLLLFSLSSTFFESNPPSALSIDLQFGSYQSLFSVPALESDIAQFNYQDLQHLKDEFSDNLAAKTFIRGFGTEDIIKLSIPKESANLWSPSPPTLERLITALSEMEIQLKFILHIQRKPYESIGSSVSPIVVAERSVKLKNETYHEFIEAIRGNKSRCIIIPDFYPRFIHAKARSDPKEIAAFKLGNDANNGYYGNACISLAGIGNVRYWYMSTILHNSTVDANHIEIPIEVIIFSDKISPESISFLTKYGIVGIYTTFVLLVARIIRSLCEVSTTIMFREIPNVDSLLQLCSDVRLVRERRLFRYEEQLFAQLIFLYRSPETLIKFTRLKAD